MRGAEYVSTVCLEDLWRELDAWIYDHVVARGLRLSAFLKAKARLWHEICRTTS